MGETKAQETNFGHTLVSKAFQLQMPRALSPQCEWEFLYNSCSCPFSPVSMFFIIQTALVLSQLPL